MIEVRGTADFLACIEQLLDSDREELMIATTHAGFNPHWLVLAADARLATDSEVRRDLHGLHWSGELTSELYAQARLHSGGVLLAHAHHGSGRPPGLSMTDTSTVDEILPHLGSLLPDALHAYLVFNKTHATGWVQHGVHRRALGLVRVAGCPIRRWPSSFEAAHELRDRDDRQAGALGDAGVALLRTAKIGIVGLGGAGSQVNEMLAHAGVAMTVLADRDVVKDVNLSRTHGTRPNTIGNPKVEVARDLFTSILPDADVIAIRDDFPTSTLLSEFRDVEVIVACVDNVHARNELNRFCLRYGIPLVDVGTTITRGPLQIDGHLTRFVPGSQCLQCAGHVTEGLLAEEAEHARQGKYGVNSRRPQVVSFNGLLASAAVTEVIRIVTGFDEQVSSSREWHYDGVRGELRSVSLGDHPCHACVSYALLGDAMPAPDD